jgi:lactate racemase
MMNHGTREITLKQNAWHDDGNYELRFPPGWSLEVVGNQAIPAASENAISLAVNQPISSPSLVDLARGSQKVAILVDDLSRPTPANLLLKPVFEMLAQAGVPSPGIKIVMAGGTHSLASIEDIYKKTGPLPEGATVVAHDFRKDVVEIGKTRRGTPVWINREVAQSDLKIAIGCIYPHPAAGFSGGAKLLAPGAAGYETIRYLHDRMRGSKIRAGDIHNEFRDEIEQIAGLCGLNFIVNATINQERLPAAVFAGDRNEAFSRGVAYARRVYEVDPPLNPDIILIDAYPYDADLQFAFDRGLWPLEISKPGTPCILLASCPMGVGGHELYPLSNAFLARVIRRLKYFSFNDLIRFKDRLSAAQRVLANRVQKIDVVSENLCLDEIIKVLPRAQLEPSWDSLVSKLLLEYENAALNVALYRCAPLMIPRIKDKKLK